MVILGWLAAAALAAIIMLLAAITGDTGTGDALTLLVLGGVILLIVGLALIVYALWPNPDPDPEKDYDPDWSPEATQRQRAASTTSTWAWTAPLGPLSPAHRSKYDPDPDWSIPGWEPPPDLERAPRPREREPRRPERPARPARSAQASKYHH